MSRKKVNVVPDAVEHPPMTVVTPGQIADSQRNIAALIDTGASVEAIQDAERNHTAMCNAQVEQLRSICLKRYRL